MSLTFLYTLHPHSRVHARACLTVRLGIPSLGYHTTVAHKNGVHCTVNPFKSRQSIYNTVESLTALTVETKVSVKLCR